VIIRVIPGARDDDPAAALAQLHRVAAHVDQLEATVAVVAVRVGVAHLRVLGRAGGAAVALPGRAVAVGRVGAVLGRFERQKRIFAFE
jgi:hypothetical protein